MANIDFMHHTKIYYYSMQEDFFFHVLKIKAEHDNPFTPVVQYIMDFVEKLSKKSFGTCF